MRGNEGPTLNIVRSPLGFTIPMRGNELLDLGEIRVRREFTIPMRGNEIASLQDGGGFNTVYDPHEG